jgi:hypothetical protein
MVKFKLPTVRRLILLMTLLVVVSQRTPAATEADVLV